MPKIISDCGAVLGPAALIIAVLRFATTIIGAATAVTILVFGLSAMAGELFNPFFFSPFALYPVFLISFHEAEKFFGLKVICLKFKTNDKLLK